MPAKLDLVLWRQVLRCSNYRTWEVPSKTLRVKRIEKCGIKVVIVVKHRNIGRDLSLLNENTTNAIIPMVSIFSWTSLAH